MKLKIEDILKPGSIIKTDRVDDGKVKSLKESRSKTSGKSIRFPKW